MTAQEMKERIEVAIEGAEARVESDGRHYEAIVIADAFDGRPRVAQHRMVYDALRDELEDEVHALALRTFTRESWMARSRV